MKKFFLVFFPLLASALMPMPKIWAQDCSHPALPTVTCGPPETLLALDNTTISTGEVYYYDGNGDTISGTMMNGGTLVICGTVTFDGFTINAGNIIIESTGNATFNSYFNGGATNHDFYNYGTAIFNADVHITGNDHHVYNAPGGSIISNSSLTILNGGTVVNDGTATVQNLLLNGGASLCLGNNSSLIVTHDIYNDQSGSVVVNSGTACISYGENFTGNQSIISSSDLIICQLTGANDPSPPSVTGGAILVSECVDCASALNPLPVTLVSFSAACSGHEIILKWATASETNNSHFGLHKSTDLLHWTPVGTLAGAGHSNQLNEYTFTDTRTGNDIIYYRLHQTDFGGGTEIFSPVSVSCQGDTSPKNVLRLQPNPVGSYYMLSVHAHKAVPSANVVLTDVTGQKVYVENWSLIPGDNVRHMERAGLAPGTYFIHIEGIDATPIKMTLR